MWGPRVVHRHAPAPLANLLATNRKAPLTSFELALGFAPGPSGGTAARRNLAPVAIPGTGARLGIATSLPAFQYGTAAPDRACDDVTKTYMRCLDRLGANVVIQADANDGAWTGPDGADPLEHWQPLSWMGSAYRAVSDPTVHFAYAVNPFMVGNLADTPFDGQSAILQRGLRGPGCHYVGNARFIAGDDDPVNRAYAGGKPQFLALAPWVAPDGPRSGTARGRRRSGRQRLSRRPVRPDRTDRRPPLPRRPQPPRLPGGRPMTEPRSANPGPGVSRRQAIVGAAAAALATDAASAAAKTRGNRTAAAARRAT